MPVDLLRKLGKEAAALLGIETKDGLLRRFAVPIVSRIASICESWASTPATMRSCSFSDGIRTRTLMILSWEMFRIESLVPVATADIWRRHCGVKAG